MSFVSIRSLGAAAGAAVFATALGAAAPAEAVNIAAAVADVVRRDALFELRPGPWKPTQGIQMVDGKAQFDAGFNGVVHARIDASATAAGEYRLGVAGVGRVQVRIDDQLVFDRDFTSATAPSEFAYDHFRWPASFMATLAAGPHRFLVSITARAGEGRFFLQAGNEHGAVDERLQFSASDWQVAGPVPDISQTASSEAWRPVKRPPVLDFVVNPAATFKKHSLVEWHYATGVTHLAVLAAADASGDARLRAQVDRFVQFTLENLPRQRAQFERDFAWRGANYRLIRGALLDDTTAPALPFVELLRRGELPAAAPLVEDLVNFVLRQHPRLADGTLCRDEPEAQTVWADDLFMSTAFLARAAEWKKSALLWNEVANQARGFHRHLFNAVTGLYFHGYYAARATPAAFQWGRANGWFAVAMSEILRFMPKDHPGRGELLALHRQHLTALLKYQAASGLWHQVLDQPESYEETSCSAMFLLAMARGLKDGWLDPATFAGPANRAWQGVRGRVDASGVVHGICGGTAIGDSYDFYAKRPQVDHDPRGIGAVIMAAVAAGELPPEKP